MRSAPLVLATLAVLTACGGDTRRAAPTEPDRARAAVVAFRDAVAHKDYARLCTRILAPTLTRKLERAGFPCNAAMRRFFGTTREPRLRVVGVSVQGRRARVGVHTSARGQAPEEASLGLVKVGSGWRVDTFTAAARPR